MNTQNSQMSLIATKEGKFELMIIVKRYGKYWQGMLHESTCEITTELMIEKSAVEYLLTKGYKLTALGKSEF